MIAEALDKVGKDGVVTVEESNTFGMELEFVEGMQFDKGYISPYFVTDPERMEAVLDDPYILIVNKKIGSVQELLPLLEKVLQAGKPLADHRRGRRGRGPRDARRQQDPRHVQRRRGEGARVRRPSQGDAAGHRDPHGRPGHLRGDRPQARERRRSTCSGSARKVVVTKDDTTIVEGAGDEDEVKGRINQIKAEIENTDSDWDREKLQERLAKLSGGVAVVKVGAATEVELKEKKHRIEDALSATRAAIEEGIVPGGGVTLIRAEAALDKLDLEGDEATGRERSSATRWPSRPVGSRTNAGYEGAVIVEQIRAEGDSRGFNAATGEWVDMVKAGIIDPAKVTRSALQNAGLDRGASSSRPRAPSWRSPRRTRSRGRRRPRPPALSP